MMNACTAWEEMVHDGGWRDCMTSSYCIRASRLSGGALQVKIVETVTTVPLRRGPLHADDANAERRTYHGQHRF